MKKFIVFLGITAFFLAWEAPQRVDIMPNDVVHTAPVEFADSQISFNNSAL